jgi:2-polyprenyl-3-methyl-5-hydroxy-6-metoxy-1,4-benzoquinol methylase
MKQRFELTIAGCRPIEGRTVLDIGCGPGHYSVTLAQRGAKVLGIDFAESMIDIAQKRATAAGVGDRCEFRVADWSKFPIAQKFDYVLALGFMDYVSDPATTVAKIISLTSARAFLSFPAAGGILGWQRKLRYRYQHRCELFLYSQETLDKLLQQFPLTKTAIKQIARDYFVALSAGSSEERSNGVAN